MEENKNIDVLIYHGNTSTNIIDVDSVETAIKQFRAFKGEDVIIKEVFKYNRYDKKQPMEKVEDWDKKE